MPLMEGSDQQTISSNIGELLRARKARGGKMRFGSHGPTKYVGLAKARQIAAAIAYRKARES